MVVVCEDRIRTLSSSVVNGLVDIHKLWAPKTEVLPKWFIDALSVPREEGYVEVANARLHYFRWGKRGNPPLLMAHGFLSHARCYAFIAPFFASRYDVIAYDLSGMGDSSAREESSLAVHGQEMIAISKELGLFDSGRKPVVVAHSFGGCVALEAADAAPKCFEGLIICDMMTLPPEILEEFRKTSRIRPRPFNPNKPVHVYPEYQMARDRYILSPDQPVAEPFLLEYMAYHSLLQVQDGWRWKFSPNIFNRTDESYTIGSKLVAVPEKKAIIYGEQSRLFTDESRAYVHRLGGGNIPMIAVPHAHHHLMLDQPLAFVTAIRAVMEQWEAAIER